MAESFSLSQSQTKKIRYVGTKSDNWGLSYDLAKFVRISAREFPIFFSVSENEGGSGQKKFSVKNDRELFFKSEPDGKNEICWNKI